MRPTVRQLEYLVAVAKTLNFREAAGQVHVTQPALSAQIRQLEQLLGVVLFERDRRKTLLTAAGSDAVRRAGQILRELDELADAARRFQAPLRGRIRLGAIPTIAPYLLPRVLPEVRGGYPDLKLILREEQTSVLLAMLGDGRLDAAILALPHGRPDLDDAPLLDDPFLLAVPESHPLAARKRVREDVLEREPVLLLEDGHCLRDQALSVCQAAGAHELVDFRASSMTTLLQMVRGGLGVTLVPKMAVDAGLTEGSELAAIPFVKPTPSRRVGLAWRKTSSLAADMALLAETMRRAPEVGPARA